MVLFLFVLWTGDSSESASNLGSTAYNLEASVQHYASKSHKRKACSVWVSLHVMRIPLYAKKCEARSAPCLRPGALATPNSRFSQVHATERAEGRGVIWGYFHIFTIFRPDLLRHLEHLHWGRVSHGRGFKPPYRDCSLRINLPTPIFLSLCSTLQLCWCLMKSRYLNLFFAHAVPTSKYH